jgi:tetratricopeptide (TPR) repeat protein
MNLFTSILKFFKPTSTPSPQVSERWARGIHAYAQSERLLAAGQFEDALACLDAAIDCGFDARGKAFTARAACLQALDFDLDAIDDFDKAILTEPEDCNLYFMRSFSKSAVGDLHGCVADLQEAIRRAKLHPGIAESYDAHAKEKGYAGGVIQIYQSHLAFANSDVEQQEVDESLLRGNPNHPFGPDLVTRRRMESRRRTMRDQAGAPLEGD